MEMENRAMRMLLQSMPKKGFAVTFIVFFVLLLLCVIIGAVGPQVYLYNSISAWQCPPGINQYAAIDCHGVDMAQPGAHWTGEVKNLDKLNQELRLDASLVNQFAQQEGVTKDVTMTVDIFAKNSEDAPWIPIVQNDVHSRNLICTQGVSLCNNLTIAHVLFIDYNLYLFNVTFSNSTSFNFLGDVFFTFSYVNHQYSLFELWFRFAFLLITFSMLMIFVHQMRFFNWKDWSLEQKWAGTLLFALMGYNNPFFSIELMVKGAFPVFLNRLLYMSFVVILLLYWLIAFDAVRTEAKDRKKGFYLPKIALTFAFWVSGVVAFTWIELRELNDPIYSTGSDLPGLIFFQVVLLVALLIYVFWLVYIVCRACGDMKTLPYLGLRLKVFGLFTFLVMLTVICGLIFSGVDSHNNAAEFLSFLALFNLYVYTLAFLFLPARYMGSASTETKAERIGMVRLEDEEPNRN